MRAPATASLLILIALLLLAAGCTSSHPSALANNEYGTAAATDPVTSVTVPATTGSCMGNRTLCGGFCRDLWADAANCGKCGIACPAGQVCNSGICQVAAPCSGDICPMPGTDTPGTVTSGTSDAAAALVTSVRPSAALPEGTTIPPTT